ncbi:MAG: recombinase family protein [Miltoncostaeaceae bacterium]
MNRRLIGYARVAPRERPEERPDLATQRGIIAQAAAERGWDLVRIDEDVRSGRSLRRPGLRAALESCEAGEAEGIVVARLDRLTYRLADLADLAGRALAGSFTIVALDLDLDLANESGRTTARVLATAGEWTPAPLTEPTRRLGRPGRPSSTPPEIAERIHRLRDDGMTLQAICDALNEDRIPTPRGGTHWRPTSLRSILTARSSDAGTA